MKNPLLSVIVAYANWTEKQKWWNNYCDELAKLDKEEDEESIAKRATKHLGLGAADSFTGGLSSIVGGKTVKAMIRGVKKTYFEEEK